MAATTWPSSTTVATGISYENEMVVIGTGNINTTKIYISYYYGGTTGLGCAFSNDNGATFFTTNIGGITGAKWNSITALSSSTTAYISSIGSNEILYSKVEIS